MYNKIFTKILDSSIWLEPTTTRLVWLTLIASMDEGGFCAYAAVENLSHRARVTVEECKEAIRCLEGPDNNSSNPDHEGRRIERVPGGWIVINAPVYREMVTRVIAKEQTRKRVEKYRLRHKALNESGNAPVTVVKRSVTKSTPSEAGARAVSEAAAGGGEAPPAAPAKKSISSLLGKISNKYTGMGTTVRALTDDQKESIRQEFDKPEVRVIDVLRYFKVSMDLKGEALENEWRKEVTGMTISNIVEVFVNHTGRKIDLPSHFRNAHRGQS